ncbi:hypothetical protein GCM10007940_07920 [Portibacter lacus]|uniref:MnmC-like methyltransferase domain-containing protein n=2 Tax=Portibacter lacus TaxID=1099794 RepID=A0AA37SMT5_9BACT|nr:hypothetical protein GCM10007940_07920 [Portibacter lacus]
MHVFIAAGLLPLLEQKSVNILEMGFGSGLNPLLTLIESEKSDHLIHFETVEAYPISLDQASQLNYLSQLNRGDLKDIFLKFHTAQSGELVRHGHFSFAKHLTKLEDAHFETKFDLVYYDAFSPLDQEELWTPEIFIHITTFLNPGAILVSYCCKGTFKRSLKAAGFQIEKIPGPPGKREMIRAVYP